MTDRLSRFPGRRSILLIVLVAFVAAAQFGCYDRRLAKKQKDVMADLQTYAESYNRMIVWGDYDGASQAVILEKRVDFLEQAQHVAEKVRIEDFAIPLCQVSPVPYPREKKEKGKAGPESEKPPVVETPAEKETPAAELPKPEDQTKLEEQKPVKKKMPKVFYGVALVRYINMTVAPSVSVRNRLVKQYWVYVEDTWYCDADLEELLE